MKKSNRRLLDGAVCFTPALWMFAVPCQAQTVTSPECKLRYTIDAVPQVFILNNLRWVGATLKVDGGQPLSIADQHDCVLAIADGSGKHEFVVDSADGSHKQASFDLDAATRADTSGAGALQNEICVLDDDGLECEYKRGWSPPNSK